MDRNEIANAIWQAGGGENSELQTPILAYLGNPFQPSRDPRVPPDSREYAGQVWIHQGVGAYIAPDDDTTNRDDYQAAVTTAFLPPGTITNSSIIYGTPVKVKTVDGLLTVVGIGGIEGSEYLEGQPEHPTSAIPINLLAYSLLRATNPPSPAVELVGGIYEVAGTLYGPPTVRTAEIISTYTNTLAGNQAVAVLVRFNPNTQAFDYTAGTAFTDTFSEDVGGIRVHDHIGAFASHYPTTHGSATLFCVGWIKFYNGMTEITNADILPGPGFLIRPDASGVSVLSDLSDVTSATQTAGFVLASDGGNYYGHALIATDLPTIPTNKGGTNLTSYASGDILYASATNVLSRLAKGTDDQILKLVSGFPAWQDEGGGGGGFVARIFRVTGGFISSTSANINPTYIDGFSETAVGNRSDPYDPDGFFTVSNDDRITVPSGGTGKYELGVEAKFYDDEGDMTGESFIMDIKIIDVTATNEQLVHHRRTGSSWAGNVESLVFSAPVSLTAGDDVRVQVWFQFGVTPTEISVGVDAFWGVQIDG